MSLLSDYQKDQAQLEEFLGMMLDHPGKSYVVNEGANQEVLVVTLGAATVGIESYGTCYLEVGPHRGYLPLTRGQPLHTRVTELYAARRELARRSFKRAWYQALGHGEALNLSEALG